MTDLEFDPFIDEIARELQQPVRLDPRFDERVMAALQPAVIPIATRRPVSAQRRTLAFSSSLGGLATLSLGLWFPTVFSRLAVMSPSVWWDRCAIYGIIEGVESKPPLKIWLDTGTHEEGWVRARELRDRLIAKGWRLYDDLQYSEVKEADHSEIAWGARVGDVLRFLYPARRRSTVRLSKTRGTAELFR